jgi:hypothetical protein
MSLLLEKIGMPSANRLIDKIAILLGVLWICFAVFIAVELIGHLIDRTSDARSQVLRAFSIFIFLVSAASLFLRFPGWRWIVVIPCLLIGIRDYLYLMIPQELTWGYDQVIAAIRLGVMLVTVAMAVLWGRLASLSKGAVGQP